MSVSFKRFSVSLLALLALAATAIAGCGGEDEKAVGPEGKVVVYSGRSAELVAPLYEKFEKETGITVEARYAGTPELASTIAEEGANSPADVFYAQDAGSIQAIEDLLAPLTKSQLKLVDEQYRDPEGRWTGVSGRVRVLTYNTDAVKQSDLPETVDEMTDPKWKDRVGIAPGNASFQAFVTAMRLTEGDDATRTWLQGMKDNGVKTFENNSAISEAVAKGEIDAGLVNHYYLYQTKAEDPDAPIANHNFKDGDPGSLVNVSAAGVLASAPNKANAERLMEFLLAEGQEFFAVEAEEKEYPLVAGYEDKLPDDLTPLAEIQGPDVSLSELGTGLSDTVTMIESIGFTGT